MRRPFFYSLLAMSAIFAAAACNSDESTKETDEHDPERVVFIVDGDTLAGDSLFIPVGQTVTVRMIFYNHADVSLDDVEGEHWSKLSFDPGTLATATVDNAHHFSQSVVVNGAANTKGIVDIGFGHDELADEHTLHAPVRITP
jgi:hypothetical protein